MPKFTNNRCNNEIDDKGTLCNAPIRWTHPITKIPEIHPITKNKRPLNLDGSLHLCMKKGQKKYFQKRPKGERITDFKEKEEEDKKNFKE